MYVNYGINVENMRVYPKVSGLAAWSENCEWYSSLPLGAVLLLFIVVSVHKIHKGLQRGRYMCEIS
jgi:hypothetical protein